MLWRANFRQNLRKILVRLWAIVIECCQILGNNTAYRHLYDHLKNSFTLGSQEHFYLEGQIAFVIPQEDNDFKIYSSTQHPSETQQIIAKMLNQKNNTINVLDTVQGLHKIITKEGKDGYIYSPMLREKN